MSKLFSNSKFPFFSVLTKTPFALVGISFLAGLITYIALSTTYPFGGDPETIMFLLIIDLSLLLILGVVIARRIVKLWVASKSGKAGSKLHARFVTIFSLLAIIPSILMAGFSSLFFFFALQSWFDDKVLTAVSESITVAESYLNEHQQNIKSDVLLIARDLNTLSLSDLQNPEILQSHFYNLSLIHGINEGIIFNRSGLIFARFGLTFSFHMKEFSDMDFDRAQSGEIILKPDESILLKDDSQDKIRALIKLDKIPNSYLLVGRYVDSKVLAHIEKSEKAATEYMKLNDIRSEVELTGITLYLVISLLLLLAAIWAGLHFATKFVRPIGNLIDAAEKIGDGKFETKVPILESKTELGRLSETFNTMTDELQSQHNELTKANDELNLKTIFMETVLSGVSSGVIGLDEVFKIQLINDSALQILNFKRKEVVRKELSEILPILKTQIENIKRDPENLAEGQLKYLDANGSTRVFLYKIAAEIQRKKAAGYVFTFHDITELISAQRKAAWSDVARRIAHEIKNPLTPIQLSAERLIRKYKAQITDDPESFSLCIDTIIRQVEQIGHMVDEFSNFARMPSPIFQKTKIVKIVNQALFFHQSAFPEIDFKSKILLLDKKVSENFEIYCDANQIDQLLKNIIQNAIDAVQMKKESLKGAEQKKYQGEMTLKIDEFDKFISLKLTDNGIGMGEYTGDELTEPYVTTKEKGTGLGLAIVKKIIEDHNGNIKIISQKKGLSVEIILPIDPR